MRPFITSVAALALLLWLPALLRAGRRRWRWRRIRPLPEAAWDRLRDDARDLGYGWSQSESPRQAAARLAAQAPLSSSEAAFEDLRLLVSAVEQARYAPAREEKVLAGNALVGAQQLARWEAAVHRGLARHSGRATRLRALLLPRSVLDLRHAAGSGIADGLDRVDQTLDRAVGRPMSSFGRHGKTDVDRRG